MSRAARLREWARGVKRNVLTLWFCMRHPRTPLAAKLLAALVVGYALSPIDLIPDFIPVLGYLDDVILVPLGVLLAMRMIPADVWSECQACAEQWSRERRGKPRSRVGAMLVVGLWIVFAYLGWRYFHAAYNR